MMNVLFYDTRSPIDLAALRHDSEGRLRVDATRSYYGGRCLLTIYGVPRLAAPNRTDVRKPLASMTIPKDMPRDTQRELLKNLAAITALHYGEDYVIRHMTPIKGESK
jgi:hypothetical protein